MHQSCSLEGNDLSHLVDGNHAGLFPRIVFERITRSYHLPYHTQTFSTYQILRLWPLWFQTRRFFHVFPRWASAKHVTAGRPRFGSQGHYLNILGRGRLGDYYITDIMAPGFVVSEKKSFFFLFSHYNMI